ncbi:hypothetical protein ACFE04_001604 [Oxalis oulophora]
MAKQQQKLPLEMIEEVLKHLPVKSLLRFTTLSKPIYSLIQTRRFIKRQLSFSTNHSLILSDILTHQIIHSWDYNASLNTNKHTLNHPFHHHPQHLCFQAPLVGSCHGLLCIFSWGEGDIVLINPITRKHHVLARVERAPGAVFHGFAYDSVNDDYMIVKITQRTGAELGVEFRIRNREVLVYSLNRNDWRKIDDHGFPYLFNCDQIMGVFVSGKLHWHVNSPEQLQRAKTSNMVAGFDLDMKNGRLVPLPDSVVSNLSRLHLSTLGDCLAIITVTLDVNEPANVWVMKEYGVKKSWEKLFSFVSGGGIRFCTNDTISCLRYSENKEEVLMHIFDNHTFWYDLKKKQIRVVEHLPIKFAATVVVHSLVSVGAIEEEKKKNQKAKVVKKRDDYLSKNFRLVGVGHIQERFLWLSFDRVMNLSINPTKAIEPEMAVRPLGAGRSDSVL